MKALVMVDLQRDFLPEGAWELSGTEEVIALVNRLQRRFKVVAATQDWHPKSHKIFAINHDGRTIGQELPFKRQTFKLTRPHCIQKTLGADLAPALQREFIHRIFQRGMDSDLNGYSAFFENDHRTSTGLTEFLRERKVTDVFVLGFSPDGAVLHTALDSQALGFTTHLFQDAVCVAPQTDAEKAEDLRLLQEAHVILANARDML